MEKLKDFYKKIASLIPKYKKYIFALIAFLVFIIIVVIVSKTGTKNPIKNIEEKQEKGGVLETSFDRWNRGENGELFASFFLQNHSPNTVEKIDIVCVAYSPDNRELARYKQSIKLSLSPNEERVLTKTYIGNLDILTQKVLCQVASWE